MAISRARPGKMTGIVSGRRDHVPVEPADSPSIAGADPPELERRPRPQTRQPIEIEPAQPADAAELTSTQIRAFHDDARRFNPAWSETNPGGPPGYDSQAWQVRMMKRGDYFTIRLGGLIVGGLIAFRIGPTTRNLGRIWVDPEYQSLGVGRTAIEWLHSRLPALTWTLETPAWAVRNHHLYESLGYRKVGARPCPDGFTEFLYERT